MEIDRPPPMGEDRASICFDGVIECLMAILLAFMPFAFGAAEAWGEEVVILISGVMVACFLLKIVFVRRVSIAWTWAYVPLGLFLLLVVIQLIPLPQSILAAVTPNTITMKTNLAGSLSKPSGTEMTISFYSLATERALRLALAVSAVFVVTINVYRRANQIKRLLAVVVIVGGAVAMLTLAQIATDAQKIYWRIPAVAIGGPYVNRNNYCQFMNLSVGAALGMLLVFLKSGFRRTPVVLSRAVERLGAKELRPAWYLSGMIVLAVASVFLSLSRGGMISLLVAWGVTIAVLGLKRRLDKWGWVMCALAVGAFACVLYVGFDSVYDRLASLWNLRKDIGRWQLVRDSVRAWAAFPLVGAGLGVHEYIYPMFDQSTILATASHVENEYVQMAEETGVVGLVLIGAFAVVILRNYLRCLQERRSICGAVAIGLGAGLLAVLIHSMCDFGLHLPSIAVLAAVFCGLMVTMSRADLPRRKETPNPARKWMALVCMLGLAGVWAWSVTGAHAASLADESWGKAQRLERQIREENWAVADADYVRLIDLTREAARRQPGNVVYRYWLNAHRWRAVSRITEPETGKTIIGPVALRTAKAVVADLENVYALCPTFGPNYSLAGQLRTFVLDDPHGADLIRKGRALAPCNPASCLAEGILEACEGNTAASLAAFRRTLALNGNWFERIIRICVFHLDRPDLAVEIARGDERRLMFVADILEGRLKVDLASKARSEATTLVLARCDSPDATALMLVKAADICFRNKENERAVMYYRRALSLECGNVTWRLNFARALAAMGQVSQARQQAGICLKLMPGMPEAKRLIAGL
ncbi:MAG: O-antigen ligase family protein [Planctomycetota bacterium]|nr:O-antigen ligase family protein [Planctomycetota bacterium]